MKTALYQKHLSLDAKIIDFSGWEMPLQYKGILKEHVAVRNRVGIFDVSHMGRICIDGKDAEQFLDYISTNQIKHQPNKSTTYTIFCNPNGGCIDDTLVFRENEKSFFCISNAVNRMKDFHHLQAESVNYHVSITHQFEDEGILAVQGPLSPTLISELFPMAVSLKSMHFDTFPFHGESVMISRTGYTGSDGFEIFASNSTTLDLWEMLLEHGKKYELEPCGLGARDTLRLEMGFALYGHEIDESITPLESVAAWVVKWEKESFLGKDALERLKKREDLRHQYGVILADRRIPRENFTVFQKDEPIGWVTSGNFSPSLQHGIAIIMVNRVLKPGDTIQIEIRDAKVNGVITTLPFFKP